VAEIQSLSDANVRSQFFFVARTNTRCWHCKSLTRVLALALPRGHETLDPDTAEAWHYANVNALIFFVEHLTEGVLSRLDGLSQYYRVSHCSATQSAYWANHCEHCGEVLGDHELHCELDGAFMPSSETAASNIQLLRIQEPFEASAAGYSFEPEFFEFVPRS
jgi:hypothetical protein